MELRRASTLRTIYIGLRTAERRRAKLDGEDEVEEWKDGFDPVKMYLRRIGQVSLLTREGEVSIAKEIEAGREIVFDCIVSCDAGIDLMLALPDRLRAGTARAREVFDEYQPSDEGSDSPVAPDVFKRFDKLKRAHVAYKEAIEAQQSAGKKATAEELEEFEKNTQRTKRRLVKAVRECKLSQRFINEVVGHLKKGLEKIDRAARRTRDLARGCGLTASCWKRRPTHTWPVIL
ncbi:MAG: sigma-70 factor domain-containing protein [bacterium]